MQNFNFICATLLDGTFSIFFPIFLCAIFGIGLIFKEKLFFNKTNIRREVLASSFGPWYSFWSYIGPKIRAAKCVQNNGGDFE